ncbi:YfbM family protein [Luteibacter yeojuensis]|uniref:DUF1877 family protein n=1 Tax=Luteibacter yeojuensis TaxID=345309 RepID=A0A0F3KVH6_9GAMM|nr:YfbM family protein [Luteibacter yeojuensis]KJV35270.1 hypothetical protein VI08_08205 [Luteibacter yeojuensis]
MSMIGNFVAVDEVTLKRLQESPGEISAFLYPDAGDGPARQLDVDKAWHAIHFVLNGSAWEGSGALGMSVLGGTEIGEDIGYGPARFLLAHQVTDVADALSKVSDADFHARFDAQAMDEQDIYPQVWSRDADDGRTYVFDYFVHMVNFYKEAVSRGDAMLLFIN